MKKILPFFLRPVILSSNCKKSSLSELEKLPPATQKKKNTFGCLINGKAWTPKGHLFSQPSLFIIVDPTFNGGDIDLRTYRTAESYYESFSIGGVPINSIGTTEISSVSNTRVNYAVISQTDVTCDMYQDAALFRKGFISITRYDLVNNIISGKFEVTIFKPNSGCDTIKITNGRFDLKF